MKISQIKELVDSIIKHYELSIKGLDWILSNLSRQELKVFMRLLSKEKKTAASPQVLPAS